MAQRTPASNHFVVEATWDNEAEVWVAESDEVPGLITEADSRIQLSRKLAVLVSELLELNNYSLDRHKDIEFVVRFRRKAAARRKERTRVPKAACRRMAGYSDQVKEILRQNGCRRERQDKWDHEIWYGLLIAWEIHSGDSSSWVEMP
jgi:hypothetical protein